MILSLSRLLIYTFTIATLCLPCSSAKLRHPVASQEKTVSSSIEQSRRARLLSSQQALHQGIQEYIESHDYQQHDNSLERRRRAQGQEEDQNNGDGGGGDCSLCQGIELLSNKSASPGVTCADVDLYYQFVWPEPVNYTVTEVGTCRSDLGYNANADLCCRASIPRYDCEQNIQDLIFSRNYNTAVPPIKSVDEPLIVSITFTYQALEGIDVEEGTATIFMDVTMKWNDPRLAWDVVDGSTCSNSIDVFTGAEIEKTMIWLPDFDLLNQVEGLQDAPDFKATIFSDGSVVWGVAGGLKAFCAFTGLSTIPFDTLGCQLLFGDTSSRFYSNLVQYRLSTPGIVTNGAFELKYNEWTIDPLLTRQGYAFSEGVIYYDVFFKRAQQHYIMNIIVPTVLLTYLSFFTFFLDLRVGERLGFGMALALVVVAQQLITVDLSPVSNQRLWMKTFVSLSFYWLFFVIVQSVIIGFLYYIREDHQAKKEGKRLSMMLPGGEERQALMGRSQEQDSNEEENALQETTKTSPDTGVEKAGEDGLPSKTEPSKKDRFLYTFSLRKFDMWCLFLAFATYTGFIVYMFVSVSTGQWEQLVADDPRWFDEADISYPNYYYNATDPNT